MIIVEEAKKKWELAVKNRMKAYNQFGWISHMQKNKPLAANQIYNKEKPACIKKYRAQ